MGMDKNNVGMEDAEMQSQSVDDNNDQGMDKNRVDVEAKPKGTYLPPIAAVDEPNSGGSEEQYDEATIEGEDNKQEGKWELRDETEKHNGNTKIEDKCNTTSEAYEESDESEEQNITKIDSKDDVMEGKELSHVINNGKDGKLALSVALMNNDAIDDDTKVGILSETPQLLGKRLTNEDTEGGTQGITYEGENEITQNGNEIVIVENKNAEGTVSSADVIDDKEARQGGASETKQKLNHVPIMLPEPVTPHVLVKCASAKPGQISGETFKNKFDYGKMDYDDNDDGTAEDQALFMGEIETFYRERSMDFKPPKFYGQPLNCLKLWKAVIRLGGYDTVTGSKLWRQVGESFNPPKTCTTVSWTFRIFYEKALLEYERHKTQTGELHLSMISLPDPSGVDIEGSGHQAPGSGRARRDAAARAMQGWQDQRLIKYGEVGETLIKDKNPSSTVKREKNLKTIGSLKQKRPNEVELSVKAPRTEISRQLTTTVVDVGPPADWVKINIRETKDCFEVYALVPGLLREEVRVQSDPAGRLVITGQPEQLDNPWGITAFKKVVSLPARIDPLQTSAVVSLHGRLFVRVPFEQPNI
ncbi:unnamed protein product [Cuscuta epithymum]|nr:unnamed protein product [Cuscuta epithymum]CAH9139556.1 unnamed protein product [Cuscuta epithymum]